MMKKLTLLFLITFVLFVGGCDTNPTVGPLYGTWILSSRDVEVIMTFNKNLTFEVKIYENGVLESFISGTFTYTETTLTFIDDDSNSALVMNFEIRGNRLRLYIEGSPQEVESIFTRI